MLSGQDSLRQDMNEGHPVWYRPTEGFLWQESQIILMMVMKVMYHKIQGIRLCCFWVLRSCGSNLLVQSISQKPDRYPALLRPSVALSISSASNMSTMSTESASLGPDLDTHHFIQESQHRLLHVGMVIMFWLIGACCSTGVQIP